jgi:predicted outer membrane repeat protein
MSRICAPIVVVIAAMSSLLCANISEAAIRTVCSDGCDYWNIQDAIDDSSDGDTVLVYPGTYTDAHGNGYVFSPKGKEITIYATGGAEETIIDGEGERRGIYCSNGETPKTVIEGFTITNGFDGNEGGGMYIGYDFNGNPSAPIVNNCIFVNNVAGYFLRSHYTYGGGVYVETIAGQSPTFTSCSFIANRSTNDGGGLYFYGDSNGNARVVDCTFHENSSGNRGGGLYGYGVSVEGCTISANTASSSSSAGAYFSGCDSTVEGTLFCGNVGGDIDGCWQNYGGNTFAASCACPDGACTVYVPGDYSTIQDAIDATGDGDDIEISPGIYYEALDFHGRGALTLRAAIGRGGVVIDAGGVGPAMNMSDAVDSGNITVEGITITGGYAERGGGVYVDGSFVASFEDCTITANESWGSGGGVYVAPFWGGQNNAIFLNCVISDNMSAANGGGIYYTQMNNTNGSNGNGTPSILWACTISDNTATDTGGGVYVYSVNLSNNNGSITTAFDDCIISQNTANRGGGIGIHWSQNSNGTNNNGSSNGNGSAVPIMLRNCTIVDNTADTDGGGLWTGSAGVQLDVCQVTGNQANYGGGFHAGEGSWVEGISTTTFDQNSAYFGGAIYLSEVDDAFIIGSDFLNNEASYGGGIYNKISTLDLMDSTFTGNQAYQGGALFEFETISVISGSTFDENAATQAGGAIYNLVSLSEIDTTHFCSNTPDDIYGAWFDEGDVTFEEICGSPAVCLGDTNADYNVDVLDLLYVILVWNTDNELADFNDDGFVNVMDLLQVISNWGECG